MPVIVYNCYNRHYILYSDYPNIEVLELEEANEENEYLLKI